MTTRLIFLTAVGFFCTSPAVKTTIVTTTAGTIRGEFIGDSHYSFKGIPYGEAPVGKLRFRDPIPREKWTGVLNTLKHGNFCPNKFGFFGLTQQAGGAEDCLFLNVYTPSLKGKRAVMFWIHGGAMMSGNGDSLLYGPDHLMTEDVVLVTINYRYSAFGFLSTGDKNAPGNQGLKDIILALKWVQENISKFGGSNDKVTIFGHSAGSVAVNFLMISDLTDGLFHQAILQSGSSLMKCIFQSDPLPSAEMLGNLLDLKFNSTVELVDELQKVDYKKIVEVERDLFTMKEPWGLEAFDFAPNVDFSSPVSKVFIGETPEDILISKKYRKIPMMIGSPNFEAMFFALYFGDPKVLDYYFKKPDFIVPESFKLKPNTSEFNETIKAMRDLYFDGQEIGTLEQWLKMYSDFVFRFPSDRAVRFYAENSDTPIYYYDFAYEGSLNYFKNFFGFKFQGASHSDELFYIFKPELSGFIPDVNSTLIRKRMTRMWANFAKFGNPTPKTDDVITELWGKYTNSEQNYLEINSEFNNRQRPIRMNTLSDLQQKYTGHF